MRKILQVLIGFITFGVVLGVLIFWFTIKRSPHPLSEPFRLEKPSVKVPPLFKAAAVPVVSKRDPHDHHDETLDVRDKLASTVLLPKERQDALAALQVKLPGLQADFDPITHAPSQVQSVGRFLTGARSGMKARDVVAEFIDANPLLFGHRSDALNKARVTREDVAKHNGMSTLVWNQEVNGVPVFKTILKANVTRNGELITINDHFVGNPMPNVQAPVISAEKAVSLAAAALEDNVPLTEVMAMAQPKGAEMMQRFTAPGLSDTLAQLTYLPMDETNLQLGWDVTLFSLARNEMFRTVVDAVSGDVLYRSSLTTDISDASFRVFADPASKKPFDSPRPMSPGYSSPQSMEPAEVARQLVTLQALDTTASPNGWINDGNTDTLGNNVDAHTDTDNNNVADTPRPNGGASRLFDFNASLTSSPASYKEAAVTNLFYLCNFIHDRYYTLGFTETAGNFQTDNFGRGGTGNDAVLADAQDGGGTNNANFSTPADGSPGRMQMYVWTYPEPDRDGDFDSEIVIHEYTHGLSNRLVGGGVGISSYQTAGMGEGWSDFYALCLLSDASDDPNAVYASGAYSSRMLSSSVTTNYYFGIRRYPYCTDLNKNPLTFKDIDYYQALPHTGVPLSPRYSVSNSNPSEVHAQGEVWCMMLWEVRSALVAKYGAAGNERMLQLTTDAMKLCPANPNFVQSRDAILQADLVSHAGADAVEIMSAFAKRGLGVGAKSPVANTTVGVVESYDLPDGLLVSPNDVFSPVATRLTGPISSSSMIYTLTNTGTSSAAWSVSKSQSWLLLSSSGGTLAPGASTTVTASVSNNVNTLPAGSYPDTVIFTNSTTGITRTRQVLLTVKPLFARAAFFALDTDPLWSREGQWAFGKPAGFHPFYGGADPTKGYTGQNVFGIALTGAFSTSAGGFEYLTAGPFNTTGMGNIAVQFKRWLNIEWRPASYATVEVSNDGVNWTIVWQNPTTDGIYESGWSTQTHSLGSTAVNQPTVYVRWGHRNVSGDGLAGWNIDDIELLAESQAPTMLASAQSLSTAMNTPVSFTLTGSDSSNPTGVPAVNVATMPAHGTLGGTAPNLTYTPDAGFSGQDSFSFTVSSGANTSAPAFVVLTVQPGPPDIALELPDGTPMADDASTLDFGVLNVGLTAKKRLRIRNVNGGALLLQSLTIGSGNAPEFSVNTPSQTLLAQGESTYITIAFSPVYTSAKRAILHIASNDPDESSYDIALSGVCSNFDGGVKLVEDANPTPGSLKVLNLTQIGGVAFFNGYNTDKGAELWKTDGTAGGTVFLADIYPGTGNSLPTSFTALSNGTVLFTAYGSGGYELWRTDGNSGLLVKDIASGVTSSNPANFVAMGSTLYFTANDNINGSELWKSDGTTAGTVMITDLYAGSTGSNPTGLINFNGTLFFAADDGVSGSELRTSNGTAAGTLLFKDIAPGASGSGAALLTVSGSSFYFTANDGVNGTELWKSDGTSGGTVMVTDISAGANSTIFSFIVADGSGGVFFAADDNSNGSELWHSDGTAAGTLLMKDANPGFASAAPQLPVRSGSLLYYTVTTASAGREIWRSNGTSAGTFMLKDIMPGAADSSPAELTANGSGGVFFTATDSSHGLELWKSDGSIAGTSLVKDVNLGGDSSTASGLGMLNGVLYFSADDGITGSELWRSDGTDAGTQMVVDSFPGTQSAQVSFVRSIGGHIMYGAFDGLFTKLWTTNGTPATTYNWTSRMMVGGDPWQPGNPVAIGGRGIFYNPGGNSGTLGLWMTDGTPDGSYVFSTRSWSTTPTNLTAAGSTMFFTAADTATNGVELWKTTGTDASIALVKDINPTASTGSSIVSIASINGSLYFSANDGTNGAEPWKSDGTTAGTILLSDIAPGSSSSSPNSFVGAGGLVFFTATSAASGRELYKTDGTPAGTSLVLDILPGTTSSNPSSLVGMGGLVYFSAAQSATGTELWKSDGTAAGTVLVKDIVAGISSSSPVPRCALGNTLFFTAVTSSTGTELWTTDGTSAGTVLLKDIWPGSNSSSTSNFIVFGNAVYFTATDGAHGIELWKSDGTTAGTVMVSDLNAGAASSAPSNLTVLGNQLYFTAATATAGLSEVFVLDLASASEIAVEYPAGINFTDGASALGFDSTMIGASTLKTLRVRNLGSGPLVLSDVTIDGADAASFATDVFDGVIVPAGGSTGVTVYFKPVSAGAKTAVLHIISNDDDEASFDITLTGSGFAAPDIEVLDSTGASLINRVSSVMLGDAPQGLSVTQTFTVRNAGVATLNLGAITLDGANAGNFTFTTPAATTLLPGASTTFTGTFTPNAQAPFRAALHLASNDPDEASFDFYITGIGSYAPGALRLSRDINQQGAGSFFSSSNVVMLGDTLIYSATTSDIGTELWKSDGTAAGTVVLKDIFTGTISSSPSNFTPFNGLIYFTAADAATGNELWKTDGTAAGTQMVKDIFTGASGSSPGSLRVMGGMLYFNASDLNGGRELWKSDGTTAGTVLVKDIYAGSNASSPSLLTVNGSTLFFTATDSATGTELWKSDGTTAGTVQVKDIASGTASSSISSLTVAGNLVFFIASDGVNGAELWVSDGTSGGTFMVKDINATAANTGSSIANLRAVGSLVMFAATDGLNGTELWRSDGTTVGTFMIELSPGSNSTSLNASAFVASGNLLFFTASLSGLPTGVTSSGTELWRSDGTVAGTFITRDIGLGSSSGGVGNLMADGQGGVFFTALESGSIVHGSELWHSDGTNQGTALVKDINPGSGSSSPSNFFLAGSVLYFSATDGVTGGELWRSDGSDSGTYLVKELNGGIASSSPLLVAASANRLYLTAVNGADGSELTALDTTTGGAQLLRDYTTGTAGSSITSVRVVNGKVIFGANDGVNGTELWVDDGHRASLLKDIQPGAGSGFVSSPAPVVVSYLPENSSTPVNLMFFAGNDGATGSELWVTDGTASGTRLVKELFSGASSGLGGSMISVNGQLFFSGSTSSSGTELWTSDGSDAGTRQVTDIYAGTPSSAPNNLTAVGATLFFSASDGINGTELWKSDGTTSGTTLVKNITPGSTGTAFGGFAAAGGQLFFMASDGSTVGAELWVSDGTSTGTFLVKDINPAANTGSSLGSMTAFNDVLYFSANDGTNGAELWRSDGTAAGTYLLKDINSGSVSSTPNSFRVVGNTLYFAATTAANGTELWKTDGSAAGTVLVKDIFSGTSSSTLSGLANINGTLYFSAASSSTIGTELWKSDGTSAGTVMVVDLRPGANLSSAPSNITAQGSRIYFSATGTDTGQEMWSLNLNPQPELAITLDGVALASSTDTVDFGLVSAGQSAAKNLAVRNDGDAVLTISSVTITGANAGDFSLSTLPASVGMSQAASFTATFTPQGQGNRTAVAHVTTNDPVLGTFDLPLSGSSPTAYQLQAQSLGLPMSGPGSGYDDDYDGDGVCNLAEVAFGMAAGQPGGGALLYNGASLTSTGQPVSASNGSTMCALYIRRKDAAALGITYSVQFSSDLASWETSAVVPTIVAQNASYEVACQSYPALLSNGQAPRFFRVRVSISP